MSDRRLLRLASFARPLLGAAVAAGVAASLVGIGQAWLFASAAAALFLGGARRHDVGALLIGLAALAAARALLDFAGERAGAGAARRVKNAARRLVLDRIASLGPSLTSRRSAGDLQALLLDGIDGLDPAVSQFLPQVGVAAAAPIVIVAVVFCLDPISGAVLVVTGPLIPFFMWLIGKGALAAARAEWTRLIALSSRFLDVLRGLTTLTLFGAVESEGERLAAVAERHRLSAMAVLRVAFMSALVLEMIATIGTAVVAVEVGLRLAYGLIEFRPALFVLVLAPEFYAPIRVLGARFHAASGGRAAATALYAILDETPGAEAHAPRRPVPDSPPQIRIEGVSFAYGCTQPPVLQAFDAVIAPGSCTALVGPNGAGKTTLTRLLLGLEQPQSGRILIDGVPLAELDVEAWRARTAWVPQDPRLLAGTIADNIRLGRPCATDAEVVEAARRAHAAEFVEALPDGLRTIVGEGGARLSAGQIQRVAIARAFLRDAPVLILDEHASYLDPATESGMLQSLRDLMRGRTTLLVAHRAVTIALAHSVIRLEAPRGHSTDVISADGADPVHGPHAPLTAPVPTITASADRPTYDAKPRCMLVHAIGECPAGFAAGGALAALTVAANVCLLGTSAYIISAAALRPQIAALAVPIVGVRFFGILRGVARYAERLMTHDTAMRIAAALRVRVYRALAPAAPSLAVRFHTGDLLARIVGDVDTVQQVVPRAAAPMMAAAVTAAGACGYLAVQSIGLALAFAALTALGAAGLCVLVGSRARSHALRLSTDRGDLAAACAELTSRLAELTAFGAAGRTAERAAERGERLTRSQARWSGAVGLASAAAGALGAAMLPLALWTLAGPAPLTVAHGVMVAALALVSVASLEAVQQLPGAVLSLRAAAAASARLDEATTPPSTSVRGGSLSTSLRGGSPTKQSPPPTPHTITASSLTFRYPGEQAAALHDVSLDLAPGKRVAVVGPSGSGKSTLIMLLAALFRAGDGSVALDGVDLDALAAGALLSRMAVVPQHVHVFQTSLRENLRIAHRQASDDEMVGALRRANLGTWLEGLAAGLDTRLGPEDLTPSAGQRRRIGIARALLRDAPFLLADEPLADLDAEAALVVAQELLAPDRSQGVMIATHRLEGLDRADEIIVLDGGRIVERGTHAALMAERGWYARYAATQERADGARAEVYGSE